MTENIVTVSITELRKRLNHYIGMASQGIDVHITRYGKAVAVMTSPENYNRRVGHEIQ